ncbi:MAG: hypothetical protein IT561_19205 [Alphaproteobacteria bacterium]|nr:hypothetical protein [Alphaproteobacteria bacterium]
MPVRLALFEDRIVGGRPAIWRAAPRAVYVREGALRAATAAGTTALAADTCTLFESELELSGDGEAWTFEAGSYDWGPLVGDAERSRVVMAHALMIDPRYPILMRADRVDFPPGIVTPRHGHGGPGIRRLLFGTLVAEIADRVHRVGPGEAWFETGRDPVVGRNIAPASAFVRTILLPTDYVGRSSFLPWTAEEASKPRGVSYRMFFDSPVQIPT